jgi:hypothetical protein
MTLLAKWQRDAIDILKEYPECIEHWEALTHETYDRETDDADVRRAATLALRQAFELDEPGGGG